MMRKEFCEKDGILITYLENNVSFEDMNTAESILFANDGTILFNNFSDDKAKTKYFIQYFKQIYPSIELLRSLDSVEAVG